MIEGAEIEVDVQVAEALADLVQVGAVHDAAATALGLEGKEGQVTVVITDDEGIQQLNRQFLGHDRPTDVLAFGTGNEEKPFVTAPEAGGYWGDVIVSYHRASEQAAEQGHPVERELRLLVIHGVLHLLGYDHVTEEDRATMWARQDEILDAAGGPVPR
jgi:probable rRNA maturation factor